ncbi:MAG: LPS assembly lipoprotein LptE [Crocinitomicaceae bacterium]|jgi:hypothetical protein
MKYVISIGIFLMLTSCWPTSVSFNDTGSIPPEWKQFSLSNLENNAPNSPINFSGFLSDKIRDGIQNNTRLKLSNSPNSGEVRLEGIITNYTISPIAIQAGDNVSKNRLTVTCNMKITIMSPKEQEMTLSSTRFADYPTDNNFSVVENELNEQISQQIVQDVINKILSNW